VPVTEGKAHGPLTDQEVDQLLRHLLVGRPDGTTIEIDQRTGRWRRDSARPEVAS